MPAVVPVTGYPSDYRTPSIGMELVFAQGESISGAGAREIIVIAPKLASGTYTVNTVYGPIKSESEVSVGGGAGGRLHRQFRKIAAANKGATVYVLPFAETSGATPVQAVGNLVITGTATAAFNWTFTVCDEEISVYVANGETATQVGDAVEAIINAKTHLPVTANNTTGTVAITSKHFGTCGGDGTYNPLKVRGISPGNGLTATFADVGATTSGVEGSTTEAAALTTALATITGRHWYYYCYDKAATAELTALRTHLANKALPRYGRRSYLVTGYNGTLAAATTVANAQNYERIEICFQLDGLSDPATLAGQLVASMQKVRETDPANGLINYAGAEWSLIPADSSDWPDEDDINDAIAAGLSIVVSKTGGSYLSMSITTRSKDSTGTYADFRAAESHRISVADYCAADLTAVLVPRIGDGFKAHPTLPSGLPDPNALIPRGVSTPFTLTPIFVKRINSWETAGLTQKSTDSIASLVVVKSPINAGRLESGFSLYARDNLSQITCRIAEASAA